MPELPRMSDSQLVAALGKFGFVKVSQQGGHVILKRENVGTEISCVIPLQDEIASGTLRSILRQAKIEPEQFLSAL